MGGPWPARAVRARRVFVPGNHEYDFGESVVGKRMPETRGSEGFDAFKRAEVVFGAGSGELFANAVIAHIRRKGIVAPRIEGRIVLK